MEYVELNNGVKNMESIRHRRIRQKGACWMQST